jgi:ABC-type multidrug transport system fused ATPase/permease subunit
MRIFELGRGLGNAVGRFRHAVAGTRRYFFVVYKLGKDIFRLFPGDTIRVLLGSGASLGCQVVALVALFAYLKALENNELLLGFAPRTSLILFVLFAIIMLLLYFGFSFLEYRSNIAILGLCRNYQNLGTQETLSLSSKLPHWFGADDSRQISIMHLRQILSKDIDHRSRMSRVLLRAIVPAVRLVLCAVALLLINLQFSLLILVIVGIPFAGLYSVGRIVADTMTARESGSQPIFPEQRELLLNSWESKAHLLPTNIDWELTLGQPDSRYRLYFKRLEAKVFGQFLINIATSLGIIVLVLSLGFFVLLEEQGNWSLWLTYLIALRYFLASLSKVARSVIQSTRFNRQVRRFTEFVTAATLAVNSKDPNAITCPRHVVDAYKGDTNSADIDDDLDDED